MKLARTRNLILILLIFTLLITESTADEVDYEALSAVQDAPETVESPEKIMPVALCSPPSSVTAIDYPNDSGNRIIVEWELSQEDNAKTGDESIGNNNPVKGYEIWKASGSADAEYGLAGFCAWGIKSFVDFTENDTACFYKVRTKDMNDVFSDFSPASLEPAFAKGQWFNTDAINGVIAIILFVGFLAVFLQMAKKGASLYIRKISGLDELDEAVGRATEMGKPILFVPGLSSIADVATIAALNILGPVAKKVAEYDSTIIVPNRDPIVFSVAQEVVQEAFLEAGRPDAYNDDMVFFLTDSQFGYAAGVDGIMVREKPATNLFLGMFWAESLVLAETGNMTGAIQIAGTDSVTQLPFFVTACDYTIIGEELYAASAYLSKQPLLVSSLKAQDFSKVIIILFLILGFLTGLTGTVVELINPDMALLPKIEGFVNILRGFFRG